MLSEEQFRQMALSLPGAAEGAHMGHPDFRAHGRIFASLHANGRTAMVKLSPEEQAVVMGESPDVFTPASGAWGRQGSTIVALENATMRATRAALLLAWEGAAQASAKSPSRESRPRVRRPARDAASQAADRPRRDSRRHVRR